MVFGNNEGRMSWIFFLFLGEVQEKSWNFIFDYESVKLCYVLQILVIARLRYINFRVGIAKSVSNKKSIVHGRVKENSWNFYLIKKICFLCKTLSKLKGHSFSLIVQLALVKY